MQFFLGVCIGVVLATSIVLLSSSWTLAPLKDPWPLDSTQKAAAAVCTRKGKTAVILHSPERVWCATPLKP